MKPIHLQRKPISIFVMVSFTVLICFWANQSPAATSAPAPENNSATSLENMGSEGSNFLEKVKSEPVVKKEKKFPWLIVGAAVVVGAAAIYFLVLKKTKYELTVTLGTGTTGTPATNKYKKGEIVPYTISAQTGYGNLKVMLDGTAVAASGSVTMDKAHTIIASATQGATIQVNSTPAGAKIYLDKVASGQVTPYTFNYSASTTKAILLRHTCGYQEWTQTVTANLGQDIVVNATLKTGILENFEIPASACWLPRNASAWSVSGGGLEVVDSNDVYEFNVYNHAFSADYTLIVKQKFTQGNLGSWSLVVLSTGSDMTNSKGYEFFIGTDRWWGIYKNNGLNYVARKGPWSYIKTAKSSALNAGIGVWNTIKIVKAGSNYSLFLNDKFVFSFVNTGWDPRYISLMATGDAVMKIHYDSVILNTGVSSESVPGVPVNGTPAATDRRSSDR